MKTAFLTSDSLCNHLKEIGLQLSIPSTLIIPKSVDPQPTFFGKLGSMLNKKSDNPPQDNILPFPILGSTFIVVRKYIALVYQYTIDDVTSELHIKHSQIIKLQYPVKKIISCDIRFATDKISIPICFLTQNGFGYLSYDIKAMKLEERNFIKLNQIITAQWITDKEYLVITYTGIAYHYIIYMGALKLANSAAIPLKNNKQQSVRNGWITSQIDEEQISTIKFFYATTSPVQTSNKMFLRVTELQRNLSGKIEVPENCEYTLETKSFIYTNDFSIIGAGQYYCVKTEKQVLIMKKKYDKYMFFDNFNQKNDQFKIFMGCKGLILSIGQKVLELNTIRFSDPKCSLKMCDIIDIPQDLQDFKINYHNTWVIPREKQYSLIFVLLRDEQVILSHLIKRQRMQKMMQKAKETPKDKLQIVRDLAINLGITHKDFYLKLWAHSKKENADIYQYLLPCNNVPSIKKQLRSTLKRRTVPVSQMMKILERISDLITSYLRQNMTPNNIQQYVKNDFLRRKLKMDEANKGLDHRIFQKIYSSSLQTLFFEIVVQQIDPVERKMDPLHAMVDQNPSKELKSLQMVFQEFKLIILEDYVGFVINFLNKFPNKLLEILEKYHFLLPVYPFTINVQKPSKTNETIINHKPQTQPKWFQQITVAEWQSQMTKERIIRQFYDNYPTSGIKQAVSWFTQSLYGIQNKGWKHGLITLSLDQFSEKIRCLEGTRLYLQICQYANYKSLESQEGDPEISIKILSILENKNNLKGQDLHSCKLYAKMHYFMLKNKIIEKQKCSILDLRDLTPEDLVAFFFLENKQQNQYIFSEFMNLYQNSSEFISILSKFIQSQNCSGIQLEILIEDVASKGNTFQEENQEIIQMLITGMCMKFEIRETLRTIEEDYQSDLGKFCLLDKISLSQKLALKVNRIKQLAQCRSIFKNFNCDKMTYNQILQLEENHGIFKLLLEKYFDKDYIDDEIVMSQHEYDEEAEEYQDESGNENEVHIPTQTIKLESPLSMLWVLLWLQQRVYYLIQKQDFILSYAQILIEWKQFEIVKTLIYEVCKNNKTILEELGIDSDLFKNELISKSLDQIYSDPNILYDEETKEQIINILNIDQQNNSLKVIQLSKLELVDILQKWGEKVRPNDIQTIFTEWRQGNKRDFIQFIIQRYIEKLDFKVFADIYKQLEISMSDNMEVDIENQEFADFTIIYAFKLLENKRYHQIIEILSFIKGLGTVPINFGLESETFLKSITDIYGNNLEQGKKMIEYFCQYNNTDEDYRIKRLYDSNLSSDVLHLWNRQDSINVNQRLIYSKSIYGCSYQLDELSSMIEKITQQPSDFYYCYYFTILGLTKPELGFSKLRWISYNLDYITDLLLKFEEYNYSQKKYWIIDFDHIIRHYLEGLIGQAISRLGIGSSIVGLNKLQSIMNSLKDSKQQNFLLLKSITRINQELKSKMKRTQRKKRYLLLKNEKQREQEQRRKEQQIYNLTKEKEEPSILNHHPGVFMNWKEIAEKRRTITKTQSHIFDSEKQLIDHIFQNYEISPSKKKTVGYKSRPSQVFNNLFLPTLNNSQKVSTVIQFIKNGEDKKVTHYPDDIVIQVIQQLIKQDPETDLYTIAGIMILKKLGDLQKLQLFKLTKYLKGEVSNLIINKIFTIDFFMKPLQATEQDKYSKLYEQLKPLILNATKQLPPTALKDVACMFGNILESFEYSSLIYFDILIDFAANATIFNSHTAFMAQYCIAGLAQYTDILVNRYEQLLNAFTNERELKLYVRQNISKIMHEKGYEQIAKQIKKL